MRYFPPWLFPTSMVALNVVVVASALVFEGRLKSNAFQYIFLYAGTIPSAARGDLEPFTLVLGSIR
jgi:hypothetical protein